MTGKSLEQVIKESVEQTAELRRSGLGGSDMAAVLGLDPYRSPLDVWMEKTGNAPPINLDSNDVVWFGKEAESLVAKYFTRRTGIELEVINSTRRHVQFPFLMAHPDRRVVGQSRGLEIKTAGWRMADQWGEEGSDQIPEHYLPQVHHYMMVEDWEAMHVACLMERQLKLYVVERSHRWDAALLDAGVNFWRRFVELERMPPIDYEQHALRSLSRIYPKPVADTLMDGARLAHLAEVREQLAKRSTEADKAKDVIDAMLLEQIQDREWCVLPDGKSLHRIHVQASEVPAYTRAAYSYFREVKTPKAVAAQLPLTITQQQETSDE